MINESLTQKPVDPAQEFENFKRDALGFERGGLPLSARIVLRATPKDNNKVTELGKENWLNWWRSRVGVFVNDLGESRPVIVNPVSLDEIPKVSLDSGRVVTDQQKKGVLQRALKQLIGPEVVFEAERAQVKKALNMAQEGMVKLRSKEKQQLWRRLKVIDGLLAVNRGQQAVTLASLPTREDFGYSLNDGQEESRQPGIYSRILTRLSGTRPVGRGVSSAPVVDEVRSVQADKDDTAAVLSVQHTRTRKINWGSAAAAMALTGVLSFSVEPGTVIDMLSGKALSPEQAERAKKMLEQDNRSGCKADTGVGKEEDLVQTISPEQLTKAVGYEATSEAMETQAAFDPLVSKETVFLENGEDFQEAFQLWEGNIRLRFPELNQEDTEFSAFGLRAEKDAKPYVFFEAYTESTKSYALVFVGQELKMIQDGLIVQPLQLMNEGGNHVYGYNEKGKFVPILVLSGDKVFFYPPGGEGVELNKDSGIFRTKAVLGSNGQVLESTGEVPTVTPEPTLTATAVNTPEPTATIEPTEVVFKSGFEAGFQQPIIDKFLEITGFASLEEAAKSYVESDQYDDIAEFGGFDRPENPFNWKTSFLYCGGGKVPRPDKLGGGWYYVGLMLHPTEEVVVPVLLSSYSRGSWSLYLNGIYDNQSWIQDSIGSQEELEAFLNQNIGLAVKPYIFISFLKEGAWNDNYLISDKVEPLMDQPGSYVRLFTNNPEKIGPQFRDTQYSWVYFKDIVPQIDPSVDPGFYLDHLQMP